MTFIGATTAFFAASVGLFQNDIKRVIAYSTCSQLGYMFAAAGVSAYGAAMFHLFTHAFFKALLFLGAGSVIHAMHHEQDMRKMGGLVKLLPFTWAMMGIGNLALTGVGIPYLFGTSGFYSKDGIINAAYLAGTPIGTYAFVLTLTAALMTAFYSWRQFLMTFHGPYRGERSMRRIWTTDSNAHAVMTDHDAGHRQPRPEAIRKSTNRRSRCWCRCSCWRWARCLQALSSITISSDRTRTVSGTARSLRWPGIMHRRRTARLGRTRAVLWRRSSGSASPITTT